MKLFEKLLPPNTSRELVRLLHEEGYKAEDEHLLAFYVMVPDEEKGELLAKRLEEEGYSCEVEWNEEIGVWNCVCYARLHLEYKEIRAMSRQLDKWSRKEFGGVTLEWGLIAEEKDPNGESMKL